MREYMFAIFTNETSSSTRTHIHLVVKLYLDYNVNDNCAVLYYINSTNDS